MSFMPTDWPSFLWGAAIGAVAAFGTGFLQKAGEKAFAYLDERLHPKPPEPIQVTGKFVPTTFQPGDCAWINQLKIYEYEEQGYTYYPHPKNAAKCFRVTSDGQKPLTEYLMVKPGALPAVSQ